MDPLAALGLAANVIQFVDFTSKLFSQTAAIYRSANGVSGETQELITITTGLQTLCARLASPQELGGYPAEDGLMSLAQGCKSAGDELVVALQKLRATGSHKKWASLTTALITVWKQPQIDAMKRRLELYKSQLALQLTKQTQALVTNQGSSILHALRLLQDENRRAGTDLASQIADVKVEISATFSRLAKEFDAQTQKHDSNKNGKGKKERSISESSLNLSNRVRSPNPVNITLETSKLLEFEGTCSKIGTSLIILRSLCFPTMKFRHSKITGAHPGTFQWISLTHFIPWLQADDDAIFWLSGKPGSGKSTLMKYLADSPETIAQLERWADTRELVTASFFFWVAGNEMQKSQEGLLQSLLYQVLRKHPKLIPTIFPSRWNGLTAHDEPESQLWGVRGTARVEEDVLGHQWTREELLAAFKRLNDHELASTRFCFFIDGLDEYDGDHSDLITVIKSLVDTSNVKICVSSRPWNVFEEAFGADPIHKIYLQNVNRDDIRLYVHSNLEQHPEFRKMIERDPRGEEIAREVVDKAQGVFLWVFLVVRSLVEGLRNCDRIVDLQRRVREFPSDLEAFFMQIFTSLDRFYHVQTARAFQVAIATHKPLPPIFYWLIDLEEEDTDYAIKSEQQPQDLEEFESRNLNIQVRLNGRCKGLLEVTTNDEEELLFREQVDFLHRTVKDFLLTKDMQTLMLSWSGTIFDAHLAICRAMLAHIKTLTDGDGTLRLDRPRNSAFLNLIVAFFTNAREAEITSTSPGHLIIDLVDELQRVLARFVNKDGSKPEFMLWESWGFQSFLELAASQNLQRYVLLKLNRQIDKLSKAEKASLLAAALASPNPSATIPEQTVPDRKLVAFLLQHGADPNHTFFKHHTVWSDFLFRTIRSTYWPKDLIYEILKDLLLHRAECEKGHCEMMPGTAKGFIVCNGLESVVSKFCHPEDSEELLSLAQRPEKGKGKGKDRSWYKKLVSFR